MRGRRLDTLVGPSICMRYDRRSLILVVVISSNICVRVSGILLLGIGSYRTPSEICCGCFARETRRKHYTLSWLGEPLVVGDIDSTRASPRSQLDHRLSGVLGDRGQK